MKKTTLLAIVAAYLFATNMFARKIEGNDTCLSLTQTETESFMGRNKIVKTTVTDGGSGVGISALMKGTTNITMAPCKMKFGERMKLQEVRKKTKEEVIVYGILAIVVRSSNKVFNLAREQPEGIFTGKIRNWRRVGSTDTKIVVYSRKTSSRTYESFEESVLKNKNYMSGILSMPAIGTIIQSVSQTKGAIGYVSLAYLDKEARPIHVLYDAGEPYMEPSLENTRNKTYPAVRPLFYYYETKNTSEVRPLIDYVMLAEGQAAVKKVGYVPVK